MMITQDQERRRIARELHDSAGQSLAALSMNLARIEQDLKHDPSHLVKAVSDAQERLRILSQEIRTTSYLLHPPLLDEVGLSSALHWYTEGLGERSGLDIKLSVAENLPRLEPEMELAIFRLVQECLTNIHRHSGSKTAQIRLAREADKVYVEVQDQGQGMSPERIADVRLKGAGVGIRGMRERVRQLGGELAIESDSGGTRITATFLHATQAKSA
jgi:two-component system NarL family sensor kinase